MLMKLPDDIWMIIIAYACPNLGSVMKLKEWCHRMEELVEENDNLWRLLAHRDGYGVSISYREPTYDRISQFGKWVRKQVQFEEQKAKEKGTIKQIKPMEINVKKYKEFGIENSSEPVEGSSFKEMYLNYDAKKGFGRPKTFCSYEKNQWIFSEEVMTWIKEIKEPIIIISNINTRETKQKEGDEILSQLLGIDAAISIPTKKDEPHLKIWGKPMIREIGGKKHAILFIQAYGITNEEIPLTLRRALMIKVMVLSSTVIIQKEENSSTWMNSLGKVMKSVSTPILFGESKYMKSLLTLSFGREKESLQAYDVIEDMRSNLSINHKNDELCKSVCYWFGKLSGMKVSSRFNDNRECRTGLWEVLDSCSRPLPLGFPLARWHVLENPNGEIVHNFLNFLQLELNSNFQDHPVRLAYDSILARFGVHFLNQQVDKSTEFFTRAVEAELDDPLDTNQFVAMTTHHTEAAIRTFTHLVKDAIFPMRTIEKLENQLRNSISLRCRNAWEQNRENSEQYCIRVFRECFKWIDAEEICHTYDDFKSSFESRFQSSVEVYMNAGVGNAIHIVLCGLASQYLRTAASIYPEDKEFVKTTNHLITWTEELTMKHTLSSDAERSCLMKRNHMQYRLISCENTIERLKYEIHLRIGDMDKSCTRSEEVLRRLQLFHLSTESMVRITSMKNEILESLQSSLIATKAERTALQIEMKDISENFEKLKRKKLQTLKHYLNQIERIPTQELVAM